MPIHQPVQTTIYTSDFQEKTYSFVVESILTPQERAGTLTVSTSAGYLLTTSVNQEPRREHTLDYSQQTDGSWLAKGNVMVIMASDTPVYGSILIRDAQAETVVLTIDTACAAIEPLALPALTVSQHALTFAQTSPGKPSFLILTVAQQHTNAPITLSTDAPDYFQLASDSRPTFQANLTLIPSPTGSHVHVRYSAPKNGLHTGQLIIHTSYEKTTVALEGRSAGLLPTLRPTLPSVRPVAFRRSIPSPPAKRGMGVLGAILVSGLLFTGYSFRCQLYPALCQEARTNPVVRVSSAQPTPPASSPREVPVSPVALRPVVSKSVRIQKRTLVADDVADPITPALLVRAPAKDVTPNGPVQENGGRPETQKVTDHKQRAENQVNQQNVQPKKSTQSTPESDLERELNRSL